MISVVSYIGEHQLLSMLLKIQLLFAIVLTSTNYSAVVLQLRCLDDTGNELLTAIVGSILIVSMFIAVTYIVENLMIIIIALFITGEKFTKYISSYICVTFFDLISSSVCLIQSLEPFIRGTLENWLIQYSTQNTVLMHDTLHLPQPVQERQFVARKKRCDNNSSFFVTKILPILL